MAQKEISQKRKRELQEPDEFITTSARILEYVAAHRLTFLLGLLGIALAGLLFFVLHIKGKTADNASFAALRKVNSAYAEVAKTEEGQKAYLKVKDDFEKFFAEYGNRIGGKLGKITYANICLKAEEWDTAISFFNEALADYGDSSMENMILSGLGYAYEGKKDWNSAIRYFKRIATGENPNLKADACFHLGFLYEKAGNQKESMAFYEKIVKEYQGSLFYDLAKDRTTG